MEFRGYIRDEAVFVALLDGLIGYVGFSTDFWIFALFKILWEESSKGMLIVLS
jgi:hypothetical protein